MIIRNLVNVEKGPGSRATVDLSYDEIRCVTNSLHQLVEIEKYASVNPIHLQSDFDKVLADFVQLFALIKHGRILEDHIEELYELKKLGEDKASFDAMNGDK